MAFEWVPGEADRFHQMMLSVTGLTDQLNYLVLGSVPTFRWITTGTNKMASLTQKWAEAVNAYSASIIIYCLTIVP